MSQSKALIINFSNTEQKRDIIRRIGGLIGLWEVSLKERKRHRSLPQNAWYHGAIVKAFWQEMQSQGEPDTHEDCHEALKYMFLHIRKTVVDRRTGEERIVEYTGSTKVLSTEAFSIYCEKCRQFLAETLALIYDSQT